MQALINVKNNKDGTKTVNARDLHEFLKSKQQFANWILNRIESYGFTENQDFVTLNKKNNRQILKEYHISLDMAKELSMVERSHEGKQARQYFIECEKILINEVQKKALPQNYKEALLALVEAEEEKEKQQLLIEEQKPSVQFCEQVSQAKNDLLIRDFAKALSKDDFKIGQNRLFDYLRENGILMSNNQPYQRFIDIGYFNVVTRVVQTNHGVITKYTPMITGKGQLALSKKLLSGV